MNEPALSAGTDYVFAYCNGASTDLAAVETGENEDVAVNVQNENFDEES